MHRRGFYESHSFSPKENIINFNKNSAAICLIMEIIKQIGDNNKRIAYILKMIAVKLIRL